MHATANAAEYTVEFDEFKAKVQKAGKAKIGGVVVDNPSEDQLLEGASSSLLSPPPLCLSFSLPIICMLHSSISISPLSVYPSFIFPPVSVLFPLFLPMRLCPSLPSHSLLRHLLHSLEGRGEEEG